MILGMVGIENDDDLVAGTNKLLRALDNFGRGRITLDQRNIACKIVGFDRSTVLRADLDVDPHDAPFATHGLKQRSVKDERASVGDPGLYDDIRMQCEDNLLQAY